MIAAKKLYPDARMIFPGTQEKNVRNFIIQNKIEFDKLKDIPFDAVKGISMYLSHLQDIKVSITGADLKQLSLKPGPIFSDIMNQRLLARLDGSVKTREEELEFARKLSGIWFHEGQIN